MKKIDFSKIVGMAVHTHGCPVHGVNGRDGRSCSCRFDYVDAEWDGAATFVIWRRLNESDDAFHARCDAKFNQMYMQNA